MRREQFFYLLLIFSASACSLQQDIEVELPEHAPVTLIECYLEPGAPARALVTRSVGYFEGEEIVPHDGLQLSLEHAGTTIQLANEYIMDSTAQVGHNYTSAHTVKYTEGGEWELVLRNKDQEVARGKARFLPRPVIKSLTHKIDKDSMVALTIQVEDDPGQENFYRVRAHLPWVNRHGFAGLWDDKMAADGVLKLSTGHVIEPTKDSPLVVTVYHIDKQYYEFLRSLQKAYDANYNPFAQPASITSNLEGNVEGIFTAVTGVSDTLYFAK